MTNQSEKKQGKFTLELPKDGSGPEMWTVELKDLDEELYITTSKIMRREGKELDAVKFLIRNLAVGGDNAEEVCKDWRAVYAATEQVLALLPQGQGRLKKN